MTSPAPYLRGVRTIPERIGSDQDYPFNLAFVPRLNLAFTHAVTFFVGENGSGKSTLIEAIAELCRLPASGGGRNELADTYTPDQKATLSRALRPSFRKQPLDGYFFRGEFQAHFASLLDTRKRDPDFLRNPYARYGGRSLQEQSHGEAFLSVLRNRITKGLFLLDEPESALSPQRQLALLSLIYELVQTGSCQFIVATHSPILMTYPSAQLVSFDEAALPLIRIEDTSHYQLTKAILAAPERFWKHLIE